MNGTVESTSSNNQVICVISCSAGQKLVANKCLNFICTPGTYFDLIKAKKKKSAIINKEDFQNQICSPCYSTCSECFGPTKLHCKNCKVNLIFIYFGKTIL